MTPRRHVATRRRGGTIGSLRRPPNQAKNSVLAAADRLFYENGIRAVGVDAIAEAAGVTKRTLYYHFATKETLIAAYLDDRDRATRLAIENTVGRNGALPGDRILAIFDHLSQWFAMPTYRGCPFNNAVAEQTGTEAAIIAARHKTAVSTWLSDQARLGGAQHPKRVGMQLLVLIDGALNGAMVSRSAAPAHAARMLAEMLLAQAAVPTSPSLAKGSRKPTPKKRQTK